VPTAAAQVQTLNPALQSVTYRRGKNTFKLKGNIFPLEALARSLRSVAIRRSLNFVLSVPTFPRATSFVLKVGQTKIFAATILSPVQERMPMICPRPVDITSLMKVCLPDRPMNRRTWLERHQQVTAATCWKGRRTLNGIRIRRIGRFFRQSGGDCRRSADDSVVFVVHRRHRRCSWGHVFTPTPPSCLWRVQPASTHIIYCLLCYLYLLFCSFYLIFLS